LQEVASRAERQYIKCRPVASLESCKRGRQLVHSADWNKLHLLAQKQQSQSVESEEQKTSLLSQISAFRPSASVFDLAKQVGAKANKKTPKNEEIKSQAPDFKDSEFFMNQGSVDVTEKGYAVNDTLSSATYDLIADEKANKSAGGRRWDAKKHKFVMNVNDVDGSKGKKMIRGESGTLIPASYRSGRFEAWKANHKGAEPSAEPEGRRFRHSKTSAPKPADKLRDDYYSRKKRIKAAEERGDIKPRNPPRSELRSVEDIRKARQLKEHRREKNARPSKKRKQ